MKKELYLTGTSTSPSSRRAWIEIKKIKKGYGNLESPSSRRAWIEIWSHIQLRSYTFVALLAEGVDRNRSNATGTLDSWVALLAEGVDRNKIALTDERNIMRSPSSRRAWIEIQKNLWINVADLVALLAEGVDRNQFRFAYSSVRFCRPPRGGRG